MGFTRSEFFGRPPLFLPGSWVLVLGVIAFCYSIVFIGIVYGDTENEHLKIAAFILLFASFIVSISGLSWNYYFYEKSNHDSIIRRAYGGYGNPFVRTDENGRLIYIKINPNIITNKKNNPDPNATAGTVQSLNATNNNIEATATNIDINEATQ
jgi:hypothetical protein